MFDRVKEHVQDHKIAYLLGSALLTGVAIGFCLDEEDQQHVFELLEAAS